MPNTAVLLIDLQHDFLDHTSGRMPVDEASAAQVLHVANAVLRRHALPNVLPVLVLNAFPPTARLANYYRHGAAVAGSPGAALDARVLAPTTVKRIIKSQPSAFSQPELEVYLRARSIEHLVVLGVMAEGCVRATVVDALRHGYIVDVVVDAVASTASWKKRLGLWAMSRAGARFCPTLADVPR